MIGIENIEHVVVVMMENRSFDNLLGWLYNDNADPPPFNIPARQPIAFEGLEENKYSNRLLAVGGPNVYASRPPTGWPPQNNPNVVPTPDPQEEFEHITAQIFGRKDPPANTMADMSGFLADYATVPGAAGSAGQIMQSYGPAEANVINQLARNFAVCDRWFASCPCQTWPNRGFVHAGSSDGHINNDDYELYGIPTIFNVLEDRQIPWGVFSDTTLIPSLTKVQFFPRLNDYEDHFYKLSSFLRRCAAPAGLPGAQLPKYSFVEPRFVPEPGLFKIDYPNDYHPPHNICRGEQFLAQVYDAVRRSAYRDKILLIITFDEHGGCFDHVSPPTGAAPPDLSPVSRDQQTGFKFDRFGVRVPTVVISSFVRPGTVFRAPEGFAPYDHTAVLATLRDWLKLVDEPGKPFLASPRIVAAPTLQAILTLSDANEKTDWPVITARCQTDATDESLQTPLNSVQKSLLATVSRDQGKISDIHASAAHAKSLVTYADALDYLHPPADTGR
jgi:phospholipase C